MPKFDPEKDARRPREALHLSDEDYVVRLHPLRWFYFYGPFLDGLNVARRRNKNLLVVVSNSMKNKKEGVFLKNFSAHSLIKRNLPRKCLCLMYDISSYEGVSFAKKYSVSSFPTIFVMDASEKEPKLLNKFEGFDNHVELAKKVAFDLALDQIPEENENRDRNNMEARRRNQLVNNLSQMLLGSMQNRQLVRQGNNNTFQTRNVNNPQRLPPVTQPPMEGEDLDEMLYGDEDEDEESAPAEPAMTAEELQRREAEEELERRSEEERGRMRRMREAVEREDRERNERESMALGDVIEMLDKRIKRREKEREEVYKKMREEELEDREKRKGENEWGKVYKEKRKEEKRKKREMMQLIKRDHSMRKKGKSAPKGKVKHEKKEEEEVVEKEKVDEEIIIPKTRTGAVRLQVFVGDEKFVVEDLLGSDAFEKVVERVEENLLEPITIKDENFGIVVRHSKECISESEFGKTLSELQLVPSAVLIFHRKRKPGFSIGGLFSSILELCSFKK